MLPAYMMLYVLQALVRRLCAATGMSSSLACTASGEEAISGVFAITEAISGTANGVSSISGTAGVTEAISGTRYNQGCD